MFGGAIISDNGLVASSDYPGYMKHEVVSSYSRDGNVNTFFTSSPTYPMVFAKPVGTAAVAILAIRSGVSGYYVDVLCDGACSIIVFRSISGAASGYGVAFYNASGALTYSSESDMLMCNSIASMADGVSVGVTGDAVSYSAAWLSCSKTNTAELPLIDTWYWVTTYYTQDWVCKDELQWQCGTENQWVCGPVYDYASNRYIDVCGYAPVYVCKYVSVNVCNYVQTLHSVDNYREIYADVTKTDWSIYRGAVFFSGGTLNFRWILHKSGFFRTLNGVTDAPGYVKPTYNAFYASQWGAHNGSIASGGSFPYTAATYNGVLTYAATLRSSDYV